MTTSSPDGNALESSTPRFEGAEAESILAENDAEELLARGQSLYSGVDLEGINSGALKDSGRSGDGEVLPNPIQRAKLLELYRSDPSVKQFLETREAVTFQRGKVAEAEKAFDSALSSQRATAESGRQAAKEYADALLEPANLDFTDADFAHDPDVVRSVQAQRDNRPLAIVGGNFGDLKAIQERQIQERRAGAFLDRLAAEPAFGKEFDRRIRLAAAKTNHDDSPALFEGAVTRVGSARQELETQQDVFAGRKLKLAEFVVGQELDRQAGTGSRIEGVFSDSFDKGRPQLWTVDTRNGDEMTVTRLVDGVLQRKSIKLKDAAARIARFGGGLRF